MRTNDLELSIQKVRRYIIGKNVIAIRYAYGNDIDLFKNSLNLYLNKKLEEGELDNFRKILGIQNKFLRKLGGRKMIDGTIRYVSDLAIKKMLDDGELQQIPNRSYCPKKFSMIYPISISMIDKLSSDDTMSNLNGKFYKQIIKELKERHSKLDLTKYHQFDSKRL